MFEKVSPMVIRLGKFLAVILLVNVPYWYGKLLHGPRPDLGIVEQILCYWIAGLFLLAGTLVVGFILFDIVRWIITGESLIISSS